MVRSCWRMEERVWRWETEWRNTEQQTASELEAKVDNSDCKEHKKDWTDWTWRRTIEEELEYWNTGFSDVANVASHSCIIRKSTTQREYCTHRSWIQSSWLLQWEVVAWNPSPWTSTDLRHWERHSLEQLDSLSIHSIHSPQSEESATNQLVQPWLPSRGMSKWMGSISPLMDPWRTERISWRHSTKWHQTTNSTFIRIRQSATAESASSI